MRDFTTKIIFQALLNCFYYVGAFSETVGYGNRVTKFLDKATNSKEVGHGRELLLKSEPTGNSAVRLSRFASRLHSERSSIVVAEFSHVTVKNPANTILIEDLCMQVKIFIGLTAQAPLYSCFFFVFIFGPHAYRQDIQRTRRPHIRTIRLWKVFHITCRWSSMAGCCRLREDTAARGTRWRVLPSTA